MVTWHLTMKLFPAKCHERATLRKLWRQTGNSSLLPAKCWPLLHVIAGISARFSKFCFCFVLLYNKSLNDWSLGAQWILFPLKFPSTSSRETLRFSGNKIHCSPRDQSLSVYYSSTGFLLLLRARPKILFSSTGYLSCVPGLRFYPETRKYRVFRSWNQP